jgi:organic hydroperoxide reductase OsmC/OhrA
MATRSAEALWTHGLKDGNGTMKLGSGAYEGAYSFASRFEQGSGTNPEELIGTAHAGCFSMALSAGLEKNAGTNLGASNPRRGFIWKESSKVFRSPRFNSKPKPTCPASTRPSSAS